MKQLLLLVAFMCSVISITVGQTAPLKAKVDVKNLRCNIEKKGDVCHLSQGQLVSVLLLDKDLGKRGRSDLADYVNVAIRKSITTVYSVNVYEHFVQRVDGGYDRIGDRVVIDIPRTAQTACPDGSYIFTYPSYRDMVVAAVENGLSKLLKTDAKIAITD
jgi:hypothetical protein